MPLECSQEQVNLKSRSTKRGVLRKWRCEPKRLLTCKQGRASSRCQCILHVCGNSLSLLRLRSQGKKLRLRLRLRSLQLRLRSQGKKLHLWQCDHCSQRRGQAHCSQRLCQRLSRVSHSSYSPCGVNHCSQCRGQAHCSQCQSMDLRVSHSS